MQEIIANSRHRIEYINAVSSLSLEKLMELTPTEPIPSRIVEEFRKKFPNKDIKEVNAYLAGFRMGLQPNAYKVSKEYLAQRKKEFV